MILDFFDGLNWLAILVATVAWFIFSAIWYSVPPISKAWRRATKVPVEGDAPLVSLFISTAILYFITTVVIALLVAATGADDAGDGLALGATLGLGFGVVGALISQLYEQKGSSYWLINGFNALVAFSIVAVILALWD